MSRPPAVSVVIDSVVGSPFIDDCPDSLFAQKNAPNFEVIVVDCRGPDNAARLAGHFPQAPFIQLSSGVEARGEIVAIIEALLGC